MKINRKQLRKLIQEEFDNVVTGREKGMSVFNMPIPGMTGLEVGDIVYLTDDAYMEADIYKYGDDYPPVRVVMVGKDGMRFVGEYQAAPGLPAEDLVFPVSAIDQEYTLRGPSEPWPWEGYDEPVAYVGGGERNPF